MRDMGNNVLAQSSIPPAAQTSATVTGTARAVKDFHEMGAVIHVGAATTLDATNYYTAKVQTGDLADGSDAADIAAADYINPHDQAGADWDRKLDTAAGADADKDFFFGFVTRGKTYARVVLVETGAADAIIGASIVAGKPKHAPV